MNYICVSFNSFFLCKFTGLDCAPTAWGIITMDGQSQALVAKENELYLVDHGGQYQKQVGIHFCRLDGHDFSLLYPG